MKYTIKDVAKKAGVSIATVSRVLNNQDKVKDKTRVKILDAVNEMDFVLNQPAKRLRSKKTWTIGITVSDILKSYHVEIAKGIESKANDLNYSTIICDCDDSYNEKRIEKERQYLNLLYEGNVDGLILVHTQLSLEELQRIKEKQYCIAVFGRNTEEINIPSVTVDNVYGAYEAVKHLCLHGYKRIAYIYGEQSMINENLRRINGYRIALKEFDLEERSEYLVDGLFTEYGGSNAFMRLIKLPEPPDAIFCSSDEMALGSLKMAKKMGIKIPSDVAIIGYDDIHFCQLTNPLLTSVNQPKHNIGVLLCEKLIFYIENKNSNIKFTNLVLKPELIIRESCGC